MPSSWMRTVSAAPRPYRPRNRRTQQGRRRTGLDRRAHRGVRSLSRLAPPLTRDHRRRRADRRARHHALPRRPDAHAVGPQPVVRRTEIPFSIDDRKILLVDDVLYTGPHHARGARRPDRLRAAEGHSADRAGRPRPSRAAHQGRLRRQEPAHTRSTRACRCACRRPTAPTKWSLASEVPHPRRLAWKPSTRARRRRRCAARDLLGIADSRPKRLRRCSTPPRR